jgi:beta-glucosidase
MKIEEKIALVGGIDVWHTAASESEKIQSVMMADGPHGLRKQIDSEDNLGTNSSYPATLFPAASTLACSFSRSLAYRMGEAIGKEARANGVAVVLGPGINIKRNPLCGRNFEYYSEDPFLSGTMGYFWIKGLQSQNVGASLKHFACNNQETFRYTSDSIVDERALRELYLKGFEIAIKADPATVMCSYNKVNGTYASENRYLLTDILRNEWHFKGTVISDWGAVSNRVKALKSGLDLEMPSSHGYNGEKLLQAYKKHEITDQDLDESAKRVLHLAKQYQDNKIVSFDQEEHHRIAYDIAAESIVLLKNDGILPLKPSDKIAVIGKFAKEPRVQGGGSSFINPYRVETVAEEISGYCSNFEIFDGYTLDDDGYNGKLIEQACSRAADFDKIIIMCGLPENYENEGQDRNNIDLPAGQKKLIEAVSKVNPNIIISLNTGSPVALPFESQVRAILNCHLLGAASARPLLDILFGNVNPSGRLAETYPKEISDDPSTGNFACGNNAVWYMESIYVGYRYYITFSKNVLYPFGYGLSYSQFCYSDLTVSSVRIEPGRKIDVKFKVKNIGAMRGKEVLQLYVENNESSVDKPLRELRQFDKIDLDVNEEKEVSFVLDESDFSYYDVYMKKFTMNRGFYKIQIAKDAEHVLLETIVECAKNESGYTEHPQTAYGRHEVYAITENDFARRLGRELPKKNVIRRRPFSMDDTLSDVGRTFVGRVLRNYAMKTAKKMTAHTVNSWMDKVIEKTLDETPIRSLAIMSGGKFPLKIAEGIVDIINRHLIRGIRKL